MATEIIKGEIKRGTAVNREKAKARRGRTNAQAEQAGRGVE